MNKLSAVNSKTVTTKVWARQGWPAVRTHLNGLAKRRTVIGTAEMPYYKPLTVEPLKCDLVLTGAGIFPDGSMALDEGGCLYRARLGLLFGIQYPEQYRTSAGLVTRQTVADLSGNGGEAIGMILHMLRIPSSRLIFDIEPLRSLVSGRFPAICDITDISRNHPQWANDLFPLFSPLLRWNPKSAVDVFSRRTYRYHRVWILDIKTQPG